MADKSSSTQTVLQAQWDAISKLAEKHGARNVRVFASVARGEETADSDIDFLVETRPTP